MEWWKESLDDNGPWWSPEKGENPLKDIADIGKYILNKIRGLLS